MAVDNKQKEDFKTTGSPFCLFGVFKRGREIYTNCSVKCLKYTRYDMPRRVNNEADTAYSSAGSTTENSHSGMSGNNRKKLQRGSLWSKRSRVTSPLFSGTSSDSTDSGMSSRSTTPPTIDPESTIWLAETKKLIIPLLDLETKRALADLPLNRFLVQLQDFDLLMMLFETVEATKAIIENSQSVANLDGSICSRLV